MEGVVFENQDGVKASVSKYYGETLQSSSDLKTSACCTAKAPPKEVLDILKQLPPEIISKYYGCGSPFPRGLKDSGLRVLDLGCGSGRDCYVCAALVGEKGYVTGIDMTPAQLEVAQKHSADWQQHLGYTHSNMRFIQGAIEQLDTAGLQPNSIDLVISNCVINLSPNKAAVLQQVHTVLAPGGEMFFSDVYCDKRLPAEVRSHEVLLGECLGGALAVEDFVQLASQAGFANPLVLEAEPITVHDTELKALLGDANFHSITFRLFKLPSDAAAKPPSTVASASTAANKIVTYQGTLSGAADKYELDHQHTFPSGVPVLVTDQIAAICSSSWLSAHFKVVDSSTCCAPKPQLEIRSTSVTTSSIADLVTAKDRSGSGGSSGGGCCGDKASCCAPASSGCCPPKDPAAAAAQAGGGCCGGGSQGSGSCGTKGCSPGTTAAAAAASGGATSNGGCGSGGGCAAQRGCC